MKKYLFLILITSIFLTGCIISGKPVVKIEILHECKENMNVEDSAIDHLGRTIAYGFCEVCDKEFYFVNGVEQDNKELVLQLLSDAKLYQEEVKDKVEQEIQQRAEEEKEYEGSFDVHNCKDTYKVIATKTNEEGLTVSECMCMKCGRSFIIKHEE